MSLALLVLWESWLLWMLWLLSVGLDAVLNWNIKEELQGNVSTATDVSVKSIMSAVSDVICLFSLQIDTEKLAWHC